MAGPPLIEIREWGRPARRLVLSRPIVVGRDCTGAMLADERVSRQHLRLVPSPTALSVVDLGSRNGTTVNGVALTRRVALVPGLPQNLKVTTREDLTMARRWMARSGR